MGFVLGRLPFNLGLSEGSWLSGARVHLADYDSRAIAPVSWTSTCPGTQRIYVELCEDLVYGATFDSCLKFLVKNTMGVRCLETKRPA